MELDPLFVSVILIFFEEQKGDSKKGFLKSVEKEKKRLEKVTKKNVEKKKLKKKVEKKS